MMQFRNNAVYQKEKIESLKSEVRIVKAKYLNVLKKTLNVQIEVDASQGAALQNANSFGAGRLIGGASGDIDNLQKSSNLVNKLADEYQIAQEKLNNAINNYNSYITAFPLNLFAMLFKFKKEEYIDSKNLEMSTMLNGFDEGEL